MISSLLAWHVYEPLFSSSVTTFLLAFFEIHHLSPCNLIVTYRLLCINWSPELVLYSCYRSCKTCESLNGKKLERSSGNGRTYLQIRVLVISELHHNGLSINSPGHRQFCLYHFRWYYWSRTLFLAIFLLAAMRRQNRIEKFQEPTLTYLYPYYCTKNLICDRHVTSILAPRYVLHVHVFTKILSVSSETPRGRYRMMK